nr:MAG TPA: hypothetical protein [Caudoviricetes sp.]
MDDEIMRKFIEAINGINTVNDETIESLAFEKTSLISPTEITYRVCEVWSIMNRLRDNREKFERLVNNVIPDLIDENLACGPARVFIKYFEYSEHCFTAAIIQTEMGEIKFFFHFANNSIQYPAEFSDLKINGADYPSVIDWKIGYSIYQILVASICDKVTLIDAPIHRRNCHEMDTIDPEMMDLMFKIHN